MLLQTAVLITSIMDLLLHNGVLADESVKPDGPVSVETCNTDSPANECIDKLLNISESNASTIESVSLASASGNSLTTYCCSKMTSSLQLPLAAIENGEHCRDLSVLSLPLTELSSSAFSPQTPCSRFDSCVLPLKPTIDCACIAGAVLCRWDNIVGPRIVYVWTTTVSQRSWLAAKNVLSYIARGTLAGEVNRDPHDEVKFFASSDSDLALATVVFSCRDSSNVASVSPDATVYSMSVIVPYSELTAFLKLKSICLEWLSRSVLQLCVLLSQVHIIYNYISYMFIYVLLVGNTLSKNICLLFL